MMLTPESIQKKHHLQISELEEIYPTASKKSKEDEAYKEAAMQATFELQHGKRGYQALFKTYFKCVRDRLKEKLCKLKCFL